MGLRKHLKKFWRYLWYDDSIGSYLLNFLVAFIVIKFIFFPVVGFALNTDYPIVAVVSGSMEQKITQDDKNGLYGICGKYFTKVDSTISLNFHEYWGYCGNYYDENYGIDKDIFSTFDYKTGLNIGDVLVIYGKKPENIDLGDVLVFIPKQRNFYENYGPVIHRVVQIDDINGSKYFTTKGDHNPDSVPSFEGEIPTEDIIGVGVFRIPYIGYAKIALMEVITGGLFRN